MKITRKTNATNRLKSRSMKVLDGYAWISDQEINEKRFFAFWQGFISGTIITAILMYVL